jgi:hypothetical protein
MDLYRRTVIICSTVMERHFYGTQFLWIGNTAWALFWTLYRDEITQHLDNRQKKGFNGHSGCRLLVPAWRG